MFYRRRLVDNHLRGLEPRAPLYTQVFEIDSSIGLPAITLTDGLGGKVRFGNSTDQCSVACDRWIYAILVGIHCLYQGQRGHSWRRERPGCSSVEESGSSLFRKGSILYHLNNATSLTVPSLLKDVSVTLSFPVFLILATKV